jgi:hypothetical protein
MYPQKIVTLGTEASKTVCLYITRPTSPAVKGAFKNGQKPQLFDSVGTVSDLQGVGSVKRRLKLWDNSKNILSSIRPFAVILSEPPFIGPPGQYTTCWNEVKIKWDAPVRLTVLFCMETVQASFTHSAVCTRTRPSCK